MTLRSTVVLTGMIAAGVDADDGHSVERGVVGGRTTLESSIRFTCCW